MKIINYIFTWIALVLVCSSCKETTSKQATATTAKPAPNIVLIVADDMGYGDISALNSSAKLSTPHLDSLVRQGVSFTDAHASSSVCTPSRYSILTGEYAWRSSLKRGVTWGYSQPIIPDEKETIASFLKKNGYQTGFIGKWHLGLGWQAKKGITAPWETSTHPSTYNGNAIDHAAPLSSGPTTLGFDYFYGISASLDMGPYCFIENTQVIDLPMHSIESKESEKIPGLTQWKQGMASKNFSHQDVLPRLTDKAVGFITENAKNENPYFLNFSLTAPHSPILPTEQFIGSSAAGPYGDFVQMVDAVVGEIITAINNSQQANNTIIIFTSDNGTPLFYLNPESSHHPNYVYRGQKADIFEGGHRIPLLAVWNNHFPKHIKIDSPVILMDLFATVADIIEQPIPQNVAIDSKSFLPNLKGDSSFLAHRDFLIHHSSRGFFAIRKDSLKLIDGLGSGGFTEPFKILPDQDAPDFQVYNLNSDLSETHNVAEKSNGQQDSLLILLRRFTKDGR